MRPWSSFKLIEILVHCSEFLSDLTLIYLVSFCLYTYQEPLYYIVIVNFLSPLVTFEKIGIWPIGLCHREP